MQALDNTIRVTGTVQDAREGQPNPRLVSDRFCVVRVEIPHARGRCWIDVAGSGRLVAELGRLVPGAQVVITGRLDSSKGADGRWRTRIWADTIDTAPEQLSMTDVAGAV